MRNCPFFLLFLTFFEIEKLDKNLLFLEHNLFCFCFDSNSFENIKVNKNNTSEINKIFKYIVNIKLFRIKNK